MTQEEVTNASIRNIEEAALACLKEAGRSLSTKEILEKIGGQKPPFGFSVLLSEALRRLTDAGSIQSDLREGHWQVSLADARSAA